MARNRSRYVHRRKGTTAEDDEDGSEAEAPCGSGALALSRTTTDEDADAEALLCWALHAERASADANATAADAEIAAATIDRISSKQRTVDLRSSRAQWMKRVASALCKGAGPAHKWANAPNVRSVQPEAIGQQH